MGGDEPFATRRAFKTDVFRGVLVPSLGHRQTLAPGQETETSSMPSTPEAHEASQQASKAKRLGISN
jgi:hypothetical protein